MERAVEGAVGGAIAVFFLFFFSQYLHAGSKPMAR